MLQPRRSRKAGEGAARKYEELTKAWRRRNRGRFLILAAVLAPMVIGVNVAAVRWSSFHWGAGLVTGMVVAMFVIARISPKPLPHNEKPPLRPMRLPTFMPEDPNFHRWIEAERRPSPAP